MLPIMKCDLKWTHLEKKPRTTISLSSSCSRFFFFPLPVLCIRTNNVQSENLESKQKKTETGVDRKRRRTKARLC